MANTRATIETYDMYKTKEVSRVGSEQSWVRAATLRTTAVASIEKDGSGYVQVVRDGTIIHRFNFGPEDVPSSPTTLD